LTLARVRFCAVFFAFAFRFDTIFNFGLCFFALGAFGVGASPVSDIMFSFLFSAALAARSIA
jgi:hypothetical protein